MDIDNFVIQFHEQFDETDMSFFQKATKFRELVEWDSMVALSIMVMISDLYDINITAEEMKTANTIEDLYNTVASKK